MSTRNNDQTDEKYQNDIIGETATHTKIVTEDLVETFADVSGDHNKFHTDPEFAEDSIFGEQIAHGHLCGSFCSAALWKLPGRIILGKDIREFTAPVTLGEEVTAHATVVEVLSENPSGKKMRCSTPVRNEDGEAVIEGEAVVKQMAGDRDE